MFVGTSFGQKRLPNPGPACFLRFSRPTVTLTAAAATDQAAGVSNSSSIPRAGYVPAGPRPRTRPYALGYNPLGPKNNHLNVKKIEKEIANSQLVASRNWLRTSTIMIAWKSLTECHPLPTNSLAAKLKSLTSHDHLQKCSSGGP